MLMVLTIGGNITIWVLMVGGGLAMGAQELIVSGLLIQLWGAEHLGRVRSALSGAMVFSSGIAPASHQRRRTFSCTSIGHAGLYHHSFSYTEITQESYVCLH